jgi:hypothetical protein
LSLDPGAVVGPGSLPCEQSCDVPPGVTMVEVPVPRHAWTDVLVCPNCGRAWLITPVATAAS